MPTRNRLASETSPYLRQHADNPVDWYPWGENAFATAREKDVPILLSIGYSACHWCHVMAHESFENERVASIMNAGFVPVKVDREERPDVDAIYMEAVQAITGGGGWPMTVFLTPDGRPFHGGTYYPRPQFVSLLEQLSEVWTDRREDIETAANQLVDAIRSGVGVPGARWATGPQQTDAVSADVLETTGDALLARFDPEWGGFGRAPKFPQPAMLETLLRAAASTGRADLETALTTTLDAMAAGGIYDHLGGGFARYSTDREWLVPHFEKMLYDNALLARVYLHAWQHTGRANYRQVVVETLDYLLRPPIRISGAGFASAEDADSEGEEGKFYVWSEPEVLGVAGAEARDWYGVTASGNWEGKNILRRPLGAELDRPSEIESARKALFENRERRVRPGLDDKVLTEWNAMAVAALAEAGAALDRPEWVDAAERVARFLLNELRTPDGRWLRSWQAGSAKHLGYAADHAWVVEALVRVYEATGNPEWLEPAVQTADALIELFWDGEANAFTTGGRDAERLIANPIDTQDGALPSANAVAAGGLFRLAALTGHERFRERAQAIIEAMGPALASLPVAFTAMVSAAETARTGITEIVVTGDRPDLLRVCRSAYLPGAVIGWGQPFSSPLWEGRDGPDTRDLAFVCVDYACKVPSREAAELAAQLGG